MGAEGILHAAQAVVDKHRHIDGWAMLKFDLRNAFSLVDRSAFLEAIREQAPDLSAWVEYCYGSAALLW